MLPWGFRRSYRLGTLDQASSQRDGGGPAAIRRLQVALERTASGGTSARLSLLPESEHCSQPEHLQLNFYHSHISVSLQVLLTLA